MMNRKEFEQYIQDNIKEYLPDSYKDAAISFPKVVKNNDVQLTGITIVRPDEALVPNIYIDNFWNDYQKGKNLDEIVGEIADARIELNTQERGMDVVDFLANYDAVKGRLHMRICDTADNQERLKTLVHTEHSDFSATYHVNLYENKDGVSSAAVTTAMLEIWNISVEQLHQDAILADKARGPVLMDMETVMSSMMFGGEVENLLEGGEIEPGGMPMFCLTNGEKINAASLILHDDIMQKIGEVMGGSFYVLPSSIHEVLIVPENAPMSVMELSAMVQEVNANEVSVQDRLSDHVQHYDRESHVMENAEKRESRLQMEKPEEKAAKKSIHNRLRENKEKSDAQKAGKTVEKADRHKGDVML